MPEAFRPGAGKAARPDFTAPVEDDAASDASPEAWPSFVAALMAEQPIPNYQLTVPVAWTEWGVGGARSAVFKAEDRRLERTVALKAMLPERAPDSDAVERFFDEARSVARVREPGRLVRALDVGRAGGRFFFASQWMRGGSLADRLARRERPRWFEREALAVVRDAARALQAVFEQGLAHRRLAPGNLLYDDDAKSWALGDLGCATDAVLWADPVDAVRARPDYAAPESCDGDPSVDVRADLYALGVLWTRLLTGAPPFAGDDPDAVMRRHAEEAPVPLREQDPRLSSATSTLAAWLLEKDRDDRPRTPQEFLARLQRHPLLDGLDALDGENGEGEDAENGAAPSEGGDGADAE